MLDIRWRTANDPVTLYRVKEEKHSSQHEYIYEDDEIVNDNIIKATTIKQGGGSATVLLGR